MKTVREDAGEDGPDAEFETESMVSCPWCGETNAIALDPAGGHHQEYVEDCQVCCRPWLVQVEFDEAGVAEVWVDTAD